VHTFANFFVVICAIKPLYYVFSDPLHGADARKYDDFSFFGNASAW
jgi:hypothetical protein